MRIFGGPSSTSAPTAQRSAAFCFIDTQFGNLGDSLINREMIRLVAERIPIEVGIANAPPGFEETLGITHFPNVIVDRHRSHEAFLLRAFSRRLRGSNVYYFFTPGGWIGEIDGNLNLRTWLHVCIQAMMYLIGIRLCQYGVSYERIGRRLGWILRARSILMHRHFVRDQESLSEAASLRVRIDGIAPDFAFGLFCGDNSVARNEISRVAFSFRTEQYPAQIEDIKKFVLFVHCTLQAAEYVFIPQVNEDAQTNAELCLWAQDIGVNARCESMPADLDACLLIYQSVDIMISNRLHALLIAGSRCRRMIAAPLSHDNRKIRSIFAAIGCADNVFDVQDHYPEADAFRLRAAAHRRISGDQQNAQLSQAFEELFG